MNATTWRWHGDERMRASAVASDLAAATLGGSTAVGTWLGYVKGVEGVIIGALTIVILALRVRAHLAAPRPMRPEP